MYNFIKENLDNGYIKNMFSWIEWVTLTGIVFSVGLKLNGLFIFIAMFLSIILYFTALIGVVAFVNLNLAKYNISKKYRGIIAFLITSITVPLLIYILTKSLMSIF